MKVSAYRHMAREIRLLSTRWQDLRCSTSMTASIQEETVRMLFHVHVEQKVEREQVAKVTGTNKDDSVPSAPKTA